MADMNVQILIEGDSLGAQKSVRLLADELQKIDKQATSAADGLKSVEKSAEKLETATKSAESLGDELVEVATSTSSFVAAGIAIGSFGQAIDNLEKKVKKFGRELSQNVSLPIAGLAALSLKNLYDVGEKIGSSGAARDFALTIQTLIGNFKELSLLVAQDLQPAFQTISNLFFNSMEAFKGLDTDTRKLIVSLGLVAAVVGPVALTISSVLSVISQLALAVSPVVTAITGFASGLGSVGAAIGVAITGIIGLMNTFRLLRAAGEDVGNALSMTFNLFVTGFNNYVVGNILTGISAIIKGMGILASNFNDELTFGLNQAADKIDDWTAQLSVKFQSSKGAIDQSLSKIGSSAGDAMTLGLLSKAEAIKNAVASMFADSGKKMNSALQSEIDKSKLLTKAEQEESEKRLQIVRNAVEQQKVLREQEAQKAADSLAQKTLQIQTMISSNLAGAFDQIATGAKSAEEAFADFASSTVRNLLNMITQALIFKALFPEGGALSNFTGLVAAKTMATGGYVSGPGTSTSDSIPARLSNGEYVMDAKSVRKYGVDFFRNLQRFSKTGSSPKRSRGLVPGFADGGLVSNAASAPQVVIQNSGQPKEVESSSYDPATAITSVILSDLQRNGSIARGLQSTYNFRRSATR